MCEHVVATPQDKWRYTCPEGHTDWRVWDGIFACQTCKRHRDAGEDTGSVYEYLIDGRTGERVYRADLEITHRPARATPNP